jgi:hypothetical protein
MNQTDIIYFNNRQECKIPLCFYLKAFVQTIHYMVTSILTNKLQHDSLLCLTFVAYGNGHEKNCPWSLIKRRNEIMVERNV